MSATTAKATRRDLKRALGNEGLKQVHALTTLVLETLVPSVEQVTATLNQQSLELGAHDRQLTAFHDRLTRFEADAKALQLLTFGQRLRFAMQALF